LAPDEPDASATVIRLILQDATEGIAIVAGARFEVERTGEIFTVTSGEFTANSPEVAVTVARAQFGTSAAAIQATDIITWQTVTSSTGAVIEQVENRNQLISNQFWQDPITGRLIFAPGPSNLVIQYAVLGDPDPPEDGNAFQESFTLPGVSSIPIGITFSDWTAATGKSVQFDPESQPAVGSGSVSNVGGNAQITSDIRNAGLRVRAEFTLPGSVEPPIRWGFAPNGETQAKRRDKIVIADCNAQILSRIVDQLPGREITAHDCAGVFLDDGSVAVSVAPYRETNFTAISEGTNSDGGQGIVWLNQAAFDAAKLVAPDGIACFKII
jgi:hypothetical protein